MEQLDVEGQRVRVLLSKAEVLLLSNTLNEICNGVYIEDWEFSTRLGTTRSKAQRLLDELGRMIASLPSEE